MARKQKSGNEQSAEAEARDEANKRRFVDQSGLEASQLPDQGRPTGYNDTVTDIGRRNLPQHHGGEMQPKTDDMTGQNEGGLRGDRDFGGSEKLGTRGKN
ncbi:MAG TPA: hypothetical protein VGN72_22005 [Tepidisphaeraceae bacterium]|jgi:hypothetical protein|nr:hypothetical protein [Tepidisphaeraceae bacterium]